MEYKIGVSLLCVYSRDVHIPGFMKVRPYPWIKNKLRSKPISIMVSRLINLQFDWKFKLMAMIDIATDIKNKNV